MMKAAAFCLLLNAIQSAHCDLPFASPQGATTQCSQAASGWCTEQRLPFFLCRMSCVHVDVVACVMRACFCTDQSNGIELHGL